MRRTLGAKVAAEFMNKHLSANDTETVERVQAALKELIPAINAFKSESVQLRVVDGFVIPMLLASELRVALDRHKAILDMQAEASSRWEALMGRASYEFVLGLAAKLLNEDYRAHLHLLQLWLDALKSQKADLNSDEAERKREEQEGLINRLAEQVEDQRAVIKAGEASLDRKRAALESLQKFLDILRSVDPQI